uniref:Uncharacterized protein n=1 Tax=Panagrolaimus davidi TaxID=227884 RepID=A0A914QJA5_9BILA
MGLRFLLTIYSGTVGHIRAIDYPDSYHGTARVIANTSRIIEIAITTPFGLYDGPVYPIGVEHIFLTLAADGLDSTDITQHDKENINPREYFDFINSTLDDD